MVLYRCDRCNREIHNSSRNNYRDGMIRYDVKFKLDSYDNEYEDHLDLCPRCTNELDLFLNGKPLAPGFPDETYLTYSDKIRDGISKGER